MIVAFAFVVHLFLLRLFKSFAARVSSSSVDPQLLAPHPHPPHLPCTAPGRWKNTINCNTSSVPRLPLLVLLLALSFASPVERIGKIAKGGKEKKQQAKGEFVARLSKLKQSSCAE